MSGIPVQSLEHSIEKLIHNGISVAIAEQTEPPSKLKSIVPRKIVRIITPSTYTSTKDENSSYNNFLLSIEYMQKSYSIAYIDISTSEFYTSTFSSEENMIREVIKISPKEILISTKLSSQQPQLSEKIENQINTKIITIDPFYFDNKLSSDKLHKTLGVVSLDGFGLKNLNASINACGAILTYLENDLFVETKVINSIIKRDITKSLIIDHTTLTHLEVFYSHSGKSLFEVMNNTKTAMGERLLKNSLFYPLTDINKIVERQNHVKELLDNSIDLSSDLSGIKDIERLMTKISNYKATPSDLLTLALSLEKIPLIVKSLSSTLPTTKSKLKVIPLAKKILETIEITHNEYFIKKGADQSLDAIKEIENNSMSLINAYREKCREDLGIKT